MKTIALFLLLSLTACAVPLMPVLGPLTITPAPIVVPLPELPQPAKEAEKPECGTEAQRADNPDCKATP